MKNPFAGNTDEEAANLDNNIDGTYRTAQCKLDYPLVGDAGVSQKCGETKGSQLVKCSGVDGKKYCNKTDNSCVNTPSAISGVPNIAEGGYDSILIPCRPGHYLFKTRHDFEIEGNPPDSARLLEQVSKVSQKVYKDYSKLLNGEDLKSKLEIWNKQFEKTREKNVSFEKFNTQQYTPNSIQRILQTQTSDNGFDKLKESIDKLDQVTNKSGRTQQCKDTYPVSTELPTQADQLNCGQNLWCGNPDYPYCNKVGKCIKNIGYEERFEPENSKDIYGKYYKLGGKFGGSCTCKLSGLTYQVSGDNNSCSSMNCNGGTIGTCNKESGPWSYAKVDCATTKPERDYTGIPDNCKPYSQTAITKPMYIRKHKREYFTGRAITDNSKVIAFEGLELSYSDADKKAIERARGYIGQNNVKFIVKMPLKFEQQYNRAAKCNEEYPLTSETKKPCGFTIGLETISVINIFFFF